MAITGQQIIEIGLQNEAAGSDSLYTAFHKAKTNFATLFACSSPFSTFTGTGIQVVANPTAGTMELVNTGVTSLIAGDGSININRSNGAITITASAGGNGGIGSVGIGSTSLTVSGSPLVGSGVISVELPSLVGVAGTYTYPTMTVDQYGRVSSITSATAAGTVSSVAVTAGAGMQVTGSPITSTGVINITNTGVTRLSAGAGISISGSTGEISISSTVTTNPGTVSSVGLSSTSLTVSPTPISTVGTLNVDLPVNTVVVGNITAGNVVTDGKLLLSGSQALANLGAVSLTTTASYFAPDDSWTATLAAGAEGQIKTLMQTTETGSMEITVTNPGWTTPTNYIGKIQFDMIGDACTLQYVNGKWYCIGLNGALLTASY